MEYMRYRHCEERKLSLINYTSNDCLLRRESTSRINERVQKIYQIQKSITWPCKEQPVIKHNEKIMPKMIWTT